MDIKYKNKKLQKICTDADTARKTYGKRMAAKIHTRIAELDAADDVETMVRYRIGRCHALTGNRKGQFALDLEHPYRLIFTEVNTEIQVVCIVEITDYH